MMKKSIFKKFDKRKIMSYNDVFKRFFDKKVF